MTVVVQSCFLIEKQPWKRMLLLGPVDIFCSKK